MVLILDIRNCYYAFTQMNLKVGFWLVSAWQQIFGLRSRLAIQQWSLAPDAKICAASLEGAVALSFCRFLGSFEPIFDFKSHVTQSRISCSPSGCDFTSFYPGRCPGLLHISPSGYNNNSCYSSDQRSDM